MTFLAPERIALLLVPIALGLGYLWLQRRRSRYALRFTDLDLLDTVAPDRPGWRRHLPAVVFLAAMLVLTLGLARPAFATEVPQSATVVVALDVSYSMRAEDVAPDRLAAAQAAARRFIEIVPADLRVGLVVFDENARAVVAPTKNHDRLLGAIDRLKLGPGTAIGEGIYTSLEQLGRAEDGSGIGSIVLLSDGSTTAGRSERDAARDAADLGVPVSTIAFGTPDGTIQMAFQTVPVPVDRDALKGVANATGGRFFEAASADQLRVVFEELGGKVDVEVEQEEVTDRFVAAALVLALAAAAGSLLWFSRLP
jgi:Ca-activated chloride channel family protein